MPRIDVARRLTDEAGVAELGAAAHGTAGHEKALGRILSVEQSVGLRRKRGDQRGNGGYSHSIVPGGFEVMS